MSEAERFLGLVRERAPWLLAPELGVCVVGSAALAHACELQGVHGPRVADVDLAWSLDVEQGKQRLAAEGVGLATTTGNEARGTLALTLAGERFEITSFRGAAHGGLEDRIRADLAGRDMTVGALAWWLSEQRMLDPLGGLQHWQDKRIVAVGDPEQRIREHPVRNLRYYRKAHECGFELDPAIRDVRTPAEVLARIPPEALAAEFQRALLECRSPGRLLQDLYDVGILQHVAPELAPQFDGRPAGPLRHHPEGSQAQHMILVLEWAAERAGQLNDRDRLAVMVAAMCHDLGKGHTPDDKLPSHPGHERRGLPHVKQLLARLPGLTDGASRRLALTVCALHLEARRLPQLRRGTLARLYDEHFRDRSFRPDLFAMVVGADSGGRSGMEQEGKTVAAVVEADIRAITRACESVDAKALRERFAQSLESFKRALHEARCRALAGWARDDGPISGEPGGPGSGS